MAKSEEKAIRKSLLFFIRQKHNKQEVRDE